jgi:phosphoglycolate phosphatase
LGIRSVLFDLDGTLADTAPDLAHALNLQRAMRRLPPLELDLIRPHASHGTRGLIKVGFGMGQEHPGFADMREQYLELYEDNLCVHTQLFPGIPILLEELERRGISWGVVTNKPERFTMPLMQALGLSRAGCIVSGDTYANAKPHPEPLLMAARLLKVAPGECIYVGDARRDVTAAKAAGMRVLVASYGYLGAEDDPASWEVDGIISAPGEIVDYL